MPPNADESSMIAWGMAVILASIATWFYLIARRLRQGVVLPYEPRTPVPWGAWATLLAAIHVIGRIAPAIGGNIESNADEMSSAFDVTMQITLAALLQCAIVGMFLTAVVVISNATRQDVGLPASGRQALRDAAIGVLACLAAFLPVIGIRAWVITQFGEPELHPMVQDVLKQEQPQVLLFAVVCFSAVVVAPICEELVFRLLLQGWLEKWDDMQRTNDECRMPNEEQESVGASSFAILYSTFFPRGAVPILASSMIFAWAHLGHSTDPFPLFALAIFLGFTYQRTHRILPCIVAHATFNAISMIMLWQTEFAA
jgi:membrane protease YdiL (CAAX protease family)